MSIVSFIESSLKSAVEALGFPYPEGVIIAEAPSHVDAEHSLNIAMLLARELKRAPKDIAEAIIGQLAQNTDYATAELAMPGFINISLSDAAYKRAVKEFSLDVTVPGPERKKVNVEYVSANPTGPLHIGNARGGPLGETVARVLEARGHDVSREFYVNDIGGQAVKFAKSVLHYYKEYFGVESAFPEGGYPAPYVKALGEEIAEAEGKRFLDMPEEMQVEAMRADAIERQVGKIRATADRMGISFDRWYPQSHLVDSGLSAAAFATLEKNDAIFEKDGATWLKSGILEDDRETVLMKSDGVGTYFLDDIAYHQEKLGARGFELIVCALGANHSGHIPRMQAGIAAIGFKPEQYQAVLYQYVQLKNEGEVTGMSKRAGNFVTADDVLDVIPLDVFNWFMLSKANETHLDFDLKLARDTSEKNPVYYVQYAHARIHSILERAQQEAVPGAYEYNAEERQLIRHLDGFAAMVAELADTRRTHILPGYLHELATRYHHFYAHHRVISDDGAPTAARLELSRLTANTLAEGLRLMNVSAPKKM